ncbi:MAG: FKBP-type peptidyl-prolyl cis-trans isomerase [Bernardetiaceae bacterium]|jgi:FKBP-type peptidyl-prolyl cis-trans isomerase|nr:FKBP-type peptidyl-prolyl cis-trans isomerase [Bernardetiaceae bacterium]
MKIKFAYWVLLSVLALGCRSRNEIDQSNQLRREDQVIREYLAANNIQAVRDNDTGIYYRILTPGAGSRPTLGDTVRLHHTGAVLYGKQFDTSRFGSPLRTNLAGTFPSGTLAGRARVPQAWQVMVPQMQLGERRQAFVPSSLGHGAAGVPDELQRGTYTVPPNSILVYDLELLEIIPRR